MRIPSVKKVNRPGTSLIEVSFATLLVGVVLVASLQTQGAAIRSRRTTNERLDGPTLVADLFAEIASMPYEDPEEGSSGIGVNSGENGSDRAEFDDVDDFDEWDEPDASRSNGMLMVGYEGWRRQVDVRWAELTDANEETLRDTGLKRIKVTVTDPTGRQTVRIGLRGRSGSLEQSLASGTTVVTAVTVAVDAGSDPLITASAPLVNHASGP